MGCQGFWNCLLKLLNFLMTIVGLAMVGYGIYLYVMYKQASSPDIGPPPIISEETMIQLGRPLIMSVSLSNSFFDNLPKAWYVGSSLVVLILLLFGWFLMFCLLNVFFYDYCDSCLFVWLRMRSKFVSCCFEL